MTGRGKWLESEIASLSKLYRRDKICDIEKVDPPTRMINKGGKAITINLANPFLDFIGTWTERGGRTIILEAKESVHPRLPVGVERGDGVSATQMGLLTRWERSGAAVGILWSRGGKIRFVSMAQAAAALSTGRKSVQWREAYKTPPIGGHPSGGFMAVMAAVYPA